MSRKFRLDLVKSPPMIGRQTSSDNDLQIPPAFPAVINIALKEWAVVCRALEQGRQILLLRKGGIHESGGEFELEHPRFLLFPTYLHQNLNMLKPPEHSGFTAVAAEPSHMRITAAAEVTDIIPVANRAQIDAVDADHVWTMPLIDMRFNYKPANPLYLLLLRVYKLAHPAELENTPSYAGCKSWVPLDSPISLSGAIPVLPDSGYEFRRGAILKSLAEHCA